MKTRLALALLLAAACQTTASDSSTTDSNAPSPPVCDIRPKELEAHGDVRIDNYYWLNDPANPDVLAYLEAENDYKTAIMAPTQGLQEELFSEFRARLQETDETVPVVRGPYAYFSRTLEGKPYPVHCRRPSSAPSAPAEVLFDVNALSQGHGYYSIGTREPSPDHTYIAYAVDTRGRRIYDIEIKNLSRGDIERGIRGTSGNLVWAQDGRTIFYVKRDPVTLRAHQVWKHRLGTSQPLDELVYEETDEEFSCYVTKSRSEKYLFIVSDQTLTSEVRALDASKPDGEWDVVIPRERGHEYSVDHAGDLFFIRTNRDAENFRLVTAPTSNPSDWSERIAHRLDTLIEDVDLFQTHFVTRERRGGLVHLIVRPIDGAGGIQPFEVQFDDPAYEARLTGNATFDTTKVRYSYSSLTTPDAVLELDLENGRTERLKDTVVGGGFDRTAYVSERIFAEADDGTSVPISLVRRRDATKPGPLLLYGYGSYGSSIDASFTPNVVSLLDRGFTYAIAHVRGGQVLGRMWYERGKLQKKMNTFTDFIACGEHLVRAGYTTTDQMFAMGGSAGGLLMGAVINMRPELFHGVMAAVPFVDVVTTMLDDTIPLTTFEYDEWGNPNREADYRYMLSYSPYDQVSAQEYPHLLVTTGLHDSQVQYFEPAKWVAKLRAMKTGKRTLLFECEMKAGHGGVSGRYDRLRKTAQTYAFFLSLLDD